MWMRFISIRRGRGCICVNEVVEILGFMGSICRGRGGSCVSEVVGILGFIGN